MKLNAKHSYYYIHLLLTLTESFLLYLDNTVPIIALTSSNDLATSTPTFKWTASEDVNFRCSYDDGTFFNCGNGTTGSWTLNNVPDGEHNFVIEGKDKIGNTGRHTFNWNKGNIKLLNSFF